MLSRSDNIDDVNYFTAQYLYDRKIFEDGVIVVPCLQSVTELISHLLAKIHEAIEDDATELIDEQADQMT